MDLLQKLFWILLGVFVFFNHQLLWPQRATDYTNVNWIFLRGKKSSLKSIFYFPLLFKFIFRIKPFPSFFNSFHYTPFFFFSDVLCRHCRRRPTFTTTLYLHVITWLMSWPSDIQAQKVLEYCICYTKVVNFYMKTSVIIRLFVTYLHLHTI